MAELAGAGSAILGVSSSAMAPLVLAGDDPTLIDIYTGGLDHVPLGGGIVEGTGHQTTILAGYDLGYAAGYAAGLAASVAEPDLLDLIPAPITYLEPEYRDQVALALSRLPHQFRGDAD